MNDADRKAFEVAWKSQNEEFNFHGWQNSADKWTYSSDPEQKGWELWQAACEWRDSQTPTAQINQRLVEAFERLLSVAERCDGWESFPQTELEAAHAALQAAREHTK